METRIREIEANGWENASELFEEYFADIANTDYTYERIAIRRCGMDDAKIGLVSGEVRLASIAFEHFVSFLELRVAAEH